MHSHKLSGCCICVRRYTLRYSGGLVPDVYHILCKQAGVFINPMTSKSPAKLRLLYEVAAITALVHCAGGQVVDHSGAPLWTQKISSLNACCGICAGSTTEVQRFVQTMKLSPTS